MEVYLDNAATTRLDERVLEAMLPYLKESYGNASSPHGLGRKARFAVEEAHERVAAHLGAEPGEIVFTSGGTEANNLALWSGLRASGGSTLVTGSAEHESVLEPAKELDASGLHVLLVDPSADGSISVTDAVSLLDGGPGLIAFMHTNNETGAVAPVVDLAQSGKSVRALFHTDAVQALGWADLDVDRLGVDLMSISAHKIYGPKGVGALFARADTVDLQPFVRGGSQERRRRGGTENVPAIVGFARALDLAVEERAERLRHLETVKQRLADNLSSALVEGFRVNTPSGGAPHLYNISFPPVDGFPVDGEMLLLNLDVAGISVSSGSACTSGTVEPSHVLLAMGRDEPTASATIRFSFGKDNTMEEMDYVAEKLTEIVARMKAVSSKQ